MKIIKDGTEERFDQKIIENRIKATRFSDWMLREVAERVENKVEDDWMEKQSMKKQMLSCGAP